MTRKNGNQPKANIKTVGQPKKSPTIQVASTTLVVPQRKRPVPLMLRRPVDETLPMVQRLLQMLTYRRPHNSETEEQFIDTYLGPIKGMQVDGAGNLWCEVKLPKGNRTILWSSHTDTVHSTQGRQTLTVGDGVVSLGDNSGSNCLGADCTAGVWLMIEMINAGVPGLYVFHRGEECGGIGSRFIANKHAEDLDDVCAAIAFDRRGEGSVITSQSGRCASDTFADSLIAILGADPALKLAYRKDPTGTFTDTANYVDVIGECSNISVGYYNEHSPDEMLNIGHLLALREALIKADWSRLACLRKPGETDDNYDCGYGYGYGNRWYGSFEDEIDAALGEASLTKPRHIHDFADEKLKALTAFVRNSPELVAEFLLDHHVGINDLLDFENELLEGNK